MCINHEAAKEWNESMCLLAVMSINRSELYYTWDKVLKRSPKWTTKFIMFSVLLSLSKEPPFYTTLILKYLCERGVCMGLVRLRNTISRKILLQNQSQNETMVLRLLSALHCDCCCSGKLLLQWYSVSFYLFIVQCIVCWRESV